MSGDSSHDRLRLRKRTIELLDAAHNDFSVRYVRFVLRERKKLAGSDFVA